MIDGPMKHLPRACSLLIFSAGWMGCASAAPPASEAPAPSVATVDLDAEPEPATAESPETGTETGEVADNVGIIGVLQPVPGPEDLEGVQGNMWGDEIGEAFGTGGLGIGAVGTGSGGEGEGIGLGSIGTIGTNGTGQGFGSGHGRLGRSPKAKPPQVRMGATSVSGRLPPEVIQRIVRSNFGRFRACYEKGLIKDPSLAGRVKMRFVISREGDVSSASGGGDMSATVTQCVIHAFRALKFPKPEGGIVTVSYPIKFAPAGPSPVRTIDGVLVERATVKELQQALGKAGATVVSFTHKDGVYRLAVSRDGKDLKLVFIAEASSAKGLGADERKRLNDKAAVAQLGGFWLSVEHADRFVAHELLALLVVETTPPPAKKSAKPGAKPQK